MRKSQHRIIAVAAWAAVGFVAQTVETGRSSPPIESVAAEPVPPAERTKPAPIINVPLRDPSICDRSAPAEQVPGIEDVGLSRDGGHAREGFPYSETLQHAILGEEIAWLKMAGWDQYHPPAGYYRYLEQPAPRKVFSTLPLPRLAVAPKLDGDLRDPIWAGASRGSIELTVPVRFAEGPLAMFYVSGYRTESDLVLAFEADRPLFRPGAVLAYVESGDRGLELRATATGLEAKPYSVKNLRKNYEPAAALIGAVAADARAVEVAIPLTNFPANIADGVTVQPDLWGLYEQSRPVIPLKRNQQKPDYQKDWKKIVFRPDVYAVREATGKLGAAFINHSDQPIELNLGVSGKESLKLAPRERRELTGNQTGPVGPEWELRWRHGKTAYALDQLLYQPLPKALAEFEKLIELRASQGRDVAASRAQLPELRQAAAKGDRAALVAIRSAKRELFFADPAFAALTEILFLKRYPLHPSHNYTEYIDSEGWPGGGIHVLHMPFADGRLRPDEARVETLFDAGLGFVRTPAADFDARKVYFAYLPPDPAKGKDLRTKDGFFRIMAMNRDGGDLRQLTDGKFNDVWPTPLPDGGLALITSRARGRFLCFHPAILTLFRMDADGGNLRALSPNDLSEWAPAVLSDGRLAWTRSEYLDKGANFGHTAWAIRPDGTCPELIYGNNTDGGYGDIREIPGTDEYVCTLVDHAGDFNGPLAVLRPVLGQANPAAVVNITPDVEPATSFTYPPIMEAFREPYPISRDFFLCSHAPLNRFGLYVVDRYGNREILHLDAELGSMRPTPLHRRPSPPLLAHALNPQLAAKNKGVFFVADVYQGLGEKVSRGEAKYLQVFEQVKSPLRQLPTGEYQVSYNPYQDWYATPVHRIGPQGGYVGRWPAYVAKAVHGLAPVHPDGSASFEAPAGKMLYFSLLDANFNELQRMRSVMHLQPGERRSCIGCHEHRALAPPGQPTLAMGETPQALTPPPWGAGPFAYVDRVQPVLDRHCVSCHDGSGEAELDLRGTRDQYAVPTSYKTLVNMKLTDYFHTGHPERHIKAEPKTFGALKSRLVQVLEGNHENVVLDRGEWLTLKTWIALNCPLWGDYRPPAERMAELQGAGPPTQAVPGAAN